MLAQHIDYKACIAAAILSTIVDGTILVVSSGKAEIEVAQRAKELL